MPIPMTDKHLYLYYTSILNTHIYTELSIYLTYLPTLQDVFLEREREGGEGELTPFPFFGSSSSFLICC